MITLEEKTAEVDGNYEAFKAQFLFMDPGLFGKFAVLRKKEIIDCFDSAADAIAYARLKYEDGSYSIQEVTDSVIDLGYYSHVCHGTSA